MAADVITQDVFKNLAEKFGLQASSSLEKLLKRIVAPIAQSNKQDQSASNSNPINTSIKGVEKSAASLASGFNKVFDTTSSLPREDKFPIVIKSILEEIKKEKTSKTPRILESSPSNLSSSNNTKDHITIVLNELVTKTISRVNTSLKEITNNSTSHTTFIKDLVDKSISHVSNTLKDTITKTNNQIKETSLKTFAHTVLAKDLVTKSISQVNSSIKEVVSKATANANTIKDFVSKSASQVSTILKENSTKTVSQVSSVLKDVSSKSTTQVNIIKEILSKTLRFTEKFRAPTNIVTPSAAPTPERKSLIDKSKDVTTVRIVDIDDRTMRNLQKMLSDLLGKQKATNVVNNISQQDSGSGLNFPGLGIIKSALGVIGIIGGMFTLLHGLVDSGPFKGLQKIVGQGLLVGGQALAGPLLKGIFAFIKTIQSSLVQLPLKMLGQAKSLFGSLIETGLKSAANLGMQAGLKGFVGRFLQGALKILTKIPFIGGLVSLGFAVSRFIRGDVVGGGIDILSGIASTFGLVPLALALDGLNAFLDIKAGGSSSEASGKKLNVIKDLVGWIGKKIYSGIKLLPVIGPLLKSIEHFTGGEFLKGLKQMAYIIPPLDFIGALMGDGEASGTARAVAAPIRGIGQILGELTGWVAKKIYEGVKLLPIIGPALKSVEHFVDGDFLKGFKQMAYIVPLFDFLGALMGDGEASGTARAVAAPIRGVGQIISSISSWLTEKLYKGIKLLPIIGPAFTSVEHFVNGEYLKGFKQMAYIFPLFDFLGALLGDEEASGAAKAVAAPVLSIGSFIAGLGEWIGKQILKVPILGHILKGLSLLANPLDTLVEWGKSIPVIQTLLDFFTSESETTPASTPSPKTENPFEIIQSMIADKAKKWWKSTWEWVKWLARRILPENIIKFLDEEKQQKSLEEQSDELAKSPSAEPTAKPAAEPAIESTTKKPTPTLPQTIQNKLSQAKDQQIINEYTRPGIKEKMESPNSTYKVTTYSSGKEEIALVSNDSQPTKTSVPAVTTNNKLKPVVTTSTTNNESAIAQPQSSTPIVQKPVQQLITDNQNEQTNKVGTSVSKMGLGSIIGKMLSPIPGAGIIAAIATNIFKGVFDEEKEDTKDSQHSNLQKLTEKKQQSNPFLRAAIQNLTSSERKKLERLSEIILNEQKPDVTKILATKILRNRLSILTNIEKNKESRDSTKTETGDVQTPTTQISAVNKKPQTYGLTKNNDGSFSDSTNFKYTEKNGKFFDEFGDDVTSELAKEHNLREKANAKKQATVVTPIRGSSLGAEKARQLQQNREKAKQLSLPNIVPQNVKDTANNTSTVDSVKTEPADGNLFELKVPMLEKIKLIAQAIKERYTKQTKNVNTLEQSEDAKNSIFSFETIKNKFNQNKETISPNLATPLKDKNTTSQTTVNNITSKDSNLLETIAGNTGASNENMKTVATGLNNIAKALEKVGSAVGEKVNIPPVVINNTQQAPSKEGKLTTTQVAKQGNPAISEFRGIMENLRAVPA